jgi:hypothetical protein
MATLVSDLLNQALRLIGVLATGETAAQSELDDAFAALNQMIDSWNAEPGGVYKNIKQSFAFSGSTATLGSGGSLTSVRPLKILAANYTYSGIMQPVKVVGGEEFGASAFERGVTAFFPKALHCDYAFPTATISVAPSCSSGALELTMLVPTLTAFAAQSDTITGNFPAGYEKALKFNLAAILAAEYGRTLDEGTLAVASGSKAALFQLNNSNYNIPAPPPAAAQ